MFLCLNVRNGGHCYVFFLFDHAETSNVWQRGSAVVSRREQVTTLHASPLLVFWPKGRHEITQPFCLDSLKIVGSMFDNQSNGFFSKTAFADLYVVTSSVVNMNSRTEFSLHCHSETFGTAHLN